MSVSPSVVWDGLELNPLSAAPSGFLAVVETVTGWYDTPAYEGRNAPLVLADGAMRGPKTAGPRDVTVTGVASGPRPDLAAFRDALVMRAASGAPAALSIPDPAGRLMTAMVRADTDGLKHTFRGPDAFRYQLTVTATDPRLYGSAETATLSNAAGVNTGWRYDVPASASADATWPATVTGTPVAAPFNWLFLLLGFSAADVVTHYQYGFGVPPGVITGPFNIPGNFDHAAIDAGDTGFVCLTADREAFPPSSVTDTQGNNWQLVADAISPAGNCTQWLYMVQNARALGAADPITVNTVTPAKYVGTVFGLKGAGEFTGAVSEYGNSLAQTATIGLPAQTANIFSVAASGEVWPQSPPEWSRVGANGANATFSVLDIMPVTAPPEAWPPPAQMVRVYPRRYASATTPTTAILVNAGNVPAPATALYTGPLGQSRLADNTGRVINVAAIDAGMQIIVDTATLGAWAEGGATRASYVLAGSQPLLVPAGGSATWTLYASGSGSVEITWRSAWH